MYNYTFYREYYFSKSWIYHLVSTSIIVVTLSSAAPEDLWQLDTAQSLMPLAADLMTEGLDSFAWQESRVKAFNSCHSLYNKHGFSGDKVIISPGRVPKGLIIPKTALKMNDALR